MIRFLRSLSLAALAVIVSLAASMTGVPVAAQTQFLSIVGDLPVMPGLTEDAASGVIFDSLAGRIVEAYASGLVAQADVVEFYAETLPQLGWCREGAVIFVREGEVLALEFVAPASAGQALGERFSLLPVKP